MEIFMTSVSVMILAYLIINQIYGYIQQERKPEADKIMVLALLLAEVLAFLLSVFSQKHLVAEPLCFIVFSMLGLFPFTLSFMPKVLSAKLLNVVVAIEYIYLAYRFLPFYKDVPLLSDKFMVSIMFVVPVLIVLVYAVSLAYRITDLKNVMVVGSVWNSVCIVVDVIYLAALMFYSGLNLMVEDLYGGFNQTNVAVFTIMMLGLQVALHRRICTSSLFILWTNHERRIVESMRLTNADVTTATPGSDVLYKNIYDRILEYFERSRPYLNPDLTINDVVGVLFTNKVYISKAIYAYTNRNFCQFVNYYRVRYAMELFRNNPALKVIDVSTRSGFNSAVSFNMAFRLYMGEKPSEWFRRERTKILKQNSK